MNRTIPGSQLRTLSDALHSFVSLRAGAMSRALERRQQAKEAAAVEAAARKEQAACTALAGTGNDGASGEIAPETVSDIVLKGHKSKLGTVWTNISIHIADTNTGVCSDIGHTNTSIHPVSYCPIWDEAVLIPSLT